MKRQIKVVSIRFYHVLILPSFSAGPTYVYVVTSGKVTSILWLFLKLWLFLWLFIIIKLNWDY